MATRKPFRADSGISTTTITVSSTDVVTNLNADLLDGHQAVYFFSPDNPQPKDLVVLTRAPDEVGLNVLLRSSENISVPLYRGFTYIQTRDTGSVIIKVLH